jgi:predicted ribosome quality control (RQC) complex YloA/Tae2 family protein
MYKNYFYLFRCIGELDKLFQNSKICEIYSQEKDKLFMRLPLDENFDFHLIISVNSQKPFITFREKHFKAKKNTISFFEKIMPAKVLSFSIAEGDRIIKIGLENSSILISLRGARSNIYMLDSQNQIFPFKKASHDELKTFSNEISKIPFTNTLTWISRIIDDTVDQTALKKLPFIGKEIIRELEFRQDISKHGLLKLIREIISEPIAVYFNENIGKQCFHPITFKSYDYSNQKEELNSYCEAVNKYFSQSFSKAGAVNLKNEMERYFFREIERLSNKLNHLKARIDSGSNEKVYKQHGDLLLSNINLLHKGVNQIMLKELSSSEEITITLDPKLSPSQNIERYFDKSRNEKIEYQKSTQLYSTSLKEYERLIKIGEILKSTDELIELQKIKKELKMKAQQPHIDGKIEKYSFRHFVIEGKYHVYVGKDSKNNDALTTKFAKQNDYWFHARSVSGSHVILRVENTKEAVPKSILQKAASIAGFYSKAKTSKLTPVSYTFKKYVVKNQRHEPGQVTLTKENVFLARPEIPKDCEMVDE